MNLRLILPIIHFFFVSGLQSQNKQDDVLIRISDSEITQGEFEWFFRNNQVYLCGEQKTVDEYLDPFISFKRKVIEAEMLGYDTSVTFIAEFTKYEKKLAEPYLTKKWKLEDLLVEAYERSRFDIHVSHILVQCEEKSSSADTAIAYNRALEIRQRILNGEDFAEVAREASDDPRAVISGGDLGFITTFMAEYSIESEVYRTQPGEISMPVRSRLGYHILKVHDSRPSRGKVHVAHIMVLTTDTMTQDQQRLAEKKINLLHDSLRSGTSFNELARRQSEDRGTALRGGELAPFGTGRMPPEFEKAAFALEKPGEISSPVKTAYGWHIIILIGRQGIGGISDVKDEYTSLIKKSGRVKHARMARLEYLKRQYGFTNFTGNISLFYDILDENIFEGAHWSVPQDINLEGRLFTIGGKDFSQYDFAWYLEETQGGYPLNKVAYLNRKMTDYIEESLDDFEISQLPFRYPEYKYKLQEYHDGLLLYDISNKMVWLKAVQDSLGLEVFYQRNKSDYRWKKRLDAVIYYCSNREVAEKAHSFLCDEANMDATFSALIASVCVPKYETNSITTASGKFEMGDHDLIDRIDWHAKVSDIYMQNDKYVFVLRKNVIPAKSKTLDEAHVDVIIDYQNCLEKKWMKKLVKKHPVKVNRKLLSTIE